MAGFELGLRLEHLAAAPFRIEGGSPWPNLMVRRYPGVLAFDHHDKILSVIGRGADAAAAEAARDRLKALWRTTSKPPGAGRPFGRRAAAAGNTRPRA